MDRNTIIGLVLIVVLMILFGIYKMPSKEQLAKQKHTLDSLNLVQLKEKQDSISRFIRIKTTTHADTSAAIQSQVVKSIADTSVFSTGSTETTEKFTTVENDKMKVTFINKGGEIYSVEIKNYKTWDQKPLILFNNGEDTFNYQFFARSKKINTGNLFFTCDKGDLHLNGQQKETISFRSYAGNSRRYIEQLYEFTGNSYEINYSFNLINMDSLIPANRDITLDWNESLNKLEENPDNERIYTTVYYKFLGEDVDNLSTRSNDSKNSLPKLEWISFQTTLFQFNSHRFIGF